MSRDNKRVTVKRLPDERGGHAAFLERAAAVAKTVPGGGSVDTSEGPICPDCAPSGSHDGNVVGILPYRACYNCNYETREEDGRYIAK